MREMKNSGNALIGEIPIERNIVRNKYSIIYEKGKNPKNLNQEGIGNPYIGATELEDINATEYTNYSTDELPMCDKDDVLVLWDGARAGIIGTNHKGAYSSTIVKLTPDKTINKKYFYWYLKAFQKYLYDCTNGTTIPHMNMEYIYDIQMLDWSVNEQKQIADYLDEKCADIDEIIFAKEKTNELLKERRQSIITEAITKGLNPNAEMKDSGIDWIGEISFSKNVVRLKHYLENQMQYGANESGTSDANGNIRYIRITDINNDSSLKDNEDNKYLTIEQAESYILKDGDVLFARSGATVGKSFIYKESYGKCAFAGYLIKAECNRTKLLPKYLFYYTSTSTYESWKNMIFIQATIQNIGADKYQEMPLIMTSIEEQKEIVDYLDKKCEEIDKLIESNNKTIEKLQEYRKSLIYEAVTGKIEVR